MSIVYRYCTGIGMSMWLRYLLYSKLKIYYSVVGSTLEWWHGAGGEWWPGQADPNQKETHTVPTWPRRTCVPRRQDPGRKGEGLLFSVFCLVSGLHVIMSRSLCVSACTVNEILLAYYNFSRYTARHLALGTWSWTHGSVAILFYTTLRQVMIVVASGGGVYRHAARCGSPVGSRRRLRRR